MKRHILFFIGMLLAGPLAWGQDLLTVTAPNGGETFAACETMLVTYTKSATATDHQRIEISFNGGRTYFQVDTLNTAGSLSGSISIPVPNRPTSQGRVRVREYSGGTALADASDADFTITGSPTVPPFFITSPTRRPTGIDTFAVASTQRIAWSGDASRVYRLSYSYSTTSGFQDIALVTGKTYYDWNIPIVSTRLFLRVQDTAEACRVAYSDTIFRSTEAVPGLGLTNFNGGEHVIAGQNYVIRWNSHNLPILDSLRLELSVDSGASWQVLSDSILVSGPYTWAVPFVSTTRALFRLTYVNDTTVRDISNGTFSITSPRITLASQTITDTLSGCDTLTVRWTAESSSGFYKVLISDNAGATWYPVTGVLPYGVTGSFSTRVKVPSVNSDSCLLAVVDPYLPSNRDTTNSFFSIHSADSLLSLTYPNGGELFLQGQNVTIRWSTLGVIPRVDVSYSPDAGQNWFPIATAATNVDSLSWITPQPPGQATYIIRVQATSDSCLATQSDGTFAVANAGVVNLLFPTGGEQFLSGFRQTIRYQAVGLGAGDSVTIAFSQDAGLTFTPIDTVPNTGSYSWLVPNIATTTGRIRVADASNDTVSASSPGSFDIVLFAPADTFRLALTTPVGGEILQGGTVDTIRWTSTGLTGLDSIAISFSADSGRTFTPVDTTLNTGRYGWMVPSISTNTALIRIASLSVDTAVSTSPAVFRISAEMGEPFVRVVKPNGGERYFIGSVDTIRWDYDSLTTYSVRIELSVDSGRSYRLVDTTANSGTYLWTVPSAATTRALIRITNRTDTTISDESDAVFTILSPQDTVRYSLTVTAPNGGETIDLLGSTQYTITWTSRGLLPTDSILVEVSVDSGATYDVIGRTLNTGSYAYDFFGYDLTTTALVRVTAIDRDTATDVSDSTFTITILEAVASRLGGAPARLLLAPNPARAGAATRVEVTGLPERASSAQLTVTDLTGRVLATRQVAVRKGTVTDTLAAPLAAGTYVVRVLTDGAAPLLYRLSVQ